MSFEDHQQLNCVQLQTVSYVSPQGIRQSESSEHFFSNHTAREVYCRNITVNAAERPQG